MSLPTSLRTWRTQLRAVMVKEVRQTLRDRRMMGILLVAPFVQLIVLGYAVNFEVDQVPTVVVDQDDSSLSREHLERLLADGTLRELAQLETSQEAQEWLDRGGASVAIIVPPGFGRDLVRGTPTQVQVLLDGSDPSRSSIAGGATAQYFASVAMDLVAERVAALSAVQGRAVSLPFVDAQPRTFYNPRLETAIFMVPGIAVMLLLIITTVLMSMGLAREREVGTLEQVMVTPISARVLMLGKLLPYVAVGLFDVTVALTASSYLFALPLRGNLVYLALATVMYLLNTLGVGLFVSTVSKSQQQAFLGAFLFMMPAMLLSGTFSPITSMPRWMQWMTYANPLRYYVTIIRGVLLRGAGLSDLLPESLALLVFGVAFITVASGRFRKRLA